MSEKALKTDRPVEYSLTPAYPKNMLLTLTNTCNHRCLMCAYRKYKPTPVVMPREKAYDILVQAYQLGVREVGFYSTSEPFMAKHLEDCTLDAKNMGYEYIYLTTNGSLANEERLKRLLDNGLNSIKFSVNAGKRETYKKVHGYDDFDKVVKNIFTTDELRKKGGGRLIYFFC